MIKLNDIPKENPFVVPDNYFEQLENDVMLRVRQERETVRRRRIYTISVAAAAVVALLVAINVWIFLPANNPQSPQLAEGDAASSSVLLASGNENDMLSTGVAMPAVEIEEVDFDNVDYQILDYYSDEMSQLDYLY